MLVEWPSSHSSERFEQQIFKGSYFFCFQTFKSVLISLITLSWIQKNSEFQQDCFYPGQVLVGKMAQFDGALWIEGGPDKILTSSSLKFKSKAQIVAQVQTVTIKSLGIQVCCLFIFLKMLWDFNFGLFFICWDIG